MPSLRERHLFALSWHWRKNIKKFIQSFAKSKKRWVALAILCSLFPLPSSLLYANSVWDAVQAGHLTWSNATTNWLANGDLVIKYNTGEGRESVCMH